MLSAVWMIMVLGALIFGALNGTLDEVAKASTDSATGAVNLAIGLVGVMAFFRFERWSGQRRRDGVGAHHFERFLPLFCAVRCQCHVVN